MNDKLVIGFIGLGFMDHGMAKIIRAAGTVDLSRFRSGLLRAILAINETGYGSKTQRRVQAGCSSLRADQWFDNASGRV